MTADSVMDHMED
jgi:dihydrofolate reductase